MRKRDALGGVPGWVGVTAAALVVAAWGPAKAQELDLSRPLTVDECVRVALGESPVIGEAEARFEQAGGTARMAMRAVLPTVTASARWGQQLSSDIKAWYLNDEFIYGKTIYSGSLRFSAYQSLLDLGSFQELRSSRAARDAVEHDLQATRSQVRQEVSASFYGCVAAALLADVEDDAVAVAREQLRRAETLFSLGSVARSDVLQAKVNLADAELNAINRHNTVRVEGSRLATRMGLDPRIDLGVDTTLAIPANDPGGTMEEWIAAAFERRPDLHAARWRLRATGLTEQAAKSDYLPTLGIQADWSRSGNSLKEHYLSDVSKTSNWSVGLGLSLTLFDGLQREGRVQSAIGQRRAQEEVLDRLTQAAALEVKDAFLSIAKERESLRAAREGVQLAAESLRLQQALYESGAGTLLEWDNARLGLRRARVSLIQAEISLLLAHLRFRTAIGE